MDEPIRKQTVSFLIRRFTEAGIRPRTRHGQNFLIDLNLQELLVKTAALEPRDVVLEVGSGTGSLTAMVAPKVAAVVTAEIDPQLFQLASEELYRFSNVTMLRIDALASKNHLNPQLLEAVRSKLAEEPGRVFKVVSNLPFHVATPILTNLLAEDEPPRTMTVTIQRELADRLVASPSTKDYGSLSLWVQSQCRVEIVRILPPSVFWPRPKVHSAIVHIELDEERRQRIPDREFFHDFIRAIFAHRRKFLRSDLISVLGRETDKSVVDEILSRLGLSPMARAEQLDLDQMLALCEAVRAVRGTASSAERKGASRNQS